MEVEIRKTKRSGEGEGKANVILKVEVVYKGIKLPRKGFVVLENLIFTVNMSTKDNPRRRSENEGKYEIGTAKPICLYSPEVHQSI